MNIPTNHQVISHKGKPVAVVVPYDDYLHAFDNSENITIPHDVVMRGIDVSIIRAWREYLGLSQTELAARMGISQPAYQQMEEKNASPRFATLKRIADAMGLDVRQLDI